MKEQHLQIGGSYVRYLETKGFTRLFYCGRLGDSDEQSAFYFAADESATMEIAGGKELADLLTERQPSQRPMRFTGVRSFQPYKNDEQIRALNERMERYARAASVTEWLWNFRKPFHGSVESWRNSRLYKRLFFQKGMMAPRYLLFCLVSIALLIAKLLIVPLYFLWHLLILPFTSFYAFMGFKQEKRTLAKRLGKEYISTREQDRIKERLKTLDADIATTRKDFFEMGRNLLALVVSVVAIVVTVSNFAKDATIRALSDQKQSLANQVTTLTATLSVRDFEIASLRADSVRENPNDKKSAAPKGSSP